MTVRLLKYQGAAITGGLPGSIVSWAGLDWSITEQGHLSATVEIGPEVETLIADGLASVQVED